MARDSSLRAPVTSQDPVTVDSKHYKVMFDNQHVRVLRVHYGAHEKSPMHSHPDVVAIFLRDQDARMKMPDGNTREMHMKTGEVQWNPAESHEPENLSDTPLDLVLVELKQPRGSRAMPEGAQDACMIDSNHYGVLLDNDRVRVVEASYEPRHKSPMHGHPDTVVVALSDAHVKFELENGKPETKHFKPGEAFWLQAQKHSPENIGDEPYKVIVVELKPKPGPRAV